jgi:lipoprotein-releasing system permease protein
MIVIEVAFMAIIGIAIGQIIALGVNYYLSVNGIALSSTFDIGGVAMDTMRSEINLKSIVVPTLLVFFSSLLVSIFPALRAARTDPARTMRFH